MVKLIGDLFSKSNEQNLNDLLGDHSLLFNIDIDDLWYQFDWDNNGSLDF